MARKRRVKRPEELTLEEAAQAAIVAYEGGSCVKLGAAVRGLCAALGRPPPGGTTRLTPRSRDLLEAAAGWARDKDYTDVIDGLLIVPVADEGDELLGEELGVDLQALHEAGEQAQDEAQRLLSALDAYVEDCAPSPTFTPADRLQLLRELSPVLGAACALAQEGRRR
jgi:hypothetical protein